jgi:hypothetical protein
MNVDTAFSLGQMFGSIEAFGIKTPTVIARPKSPALRWRRQEVGLKILQIWPAVASIRIKVGTLPHMSS